VRSRWVKAVAILSDPSETFQRWEAPFFEQPEEQAVQIPLPELEALAQAKGFQAGKEEGLESARKEAEDIVRRLSGIAQEMSQPFRTLDATVTKELAEMAMLVAQKIVKRELSIDSKVVADVFTEALQTLYKLEGEIVIFVNPADALVIRDLAGETLEGKRWKVVEDAALLPGGCQVKTATSFVDGSVERQMEVIFASLIESSENQTEV
jgi:flagellar assembly protein FliH